MSESGGKRNTLAMRWAINQALDEEMDRDPTVCLLGQDIAAPGGTFGLTRGLYDKYGPLRVRDTPISEEGMAGVTLGAAIAGCRPVLEIMFMDFLTLAMDALVNQAAKTYYLSNGAIKVPMVVRTLAGSGMRVGSHHSQSLESWFTHVPGLKVVYPSNPADTKGLLKASIRDDNPVLFLENKTMLGLKGPLPLEDDHIVEIGKAKVVRPGADVTVATYGRMVHVVSEAAEILSASGTDVEVIDLRTLLPLDAGTVLTSIAKTSRLAVVHEAPVASGFGAEISARIAEEGIFHLDAPIKRIGGAFLPVPVGEAEDLLFPTAATVVAGIRELLD